ncbi:MAG: two pore domain potassium channel family protein [Alphaproteobacteria bacterium]|nr:two pore domain potassium channel family protein [Alphaproteobacteria bacterium]
MSPSQAFTVVQIGLIAAATYDAHGWAFVGALFGLVGLALVFFHRVFRDARVFSLVLANAIGVYACIFLFLLDTNFVGVTSPLREIGFALPVLAFLIGAWRNRATIAAVIADRAGFSRRRVGNDLVWLAPMLAIGGFTFFVPEEAAAVITAFSAAMLAVAAIVMAISPTVAAFLIDSGNLFEEFFARIRRLTSAAFAFVTFYSMTVILFACLYRVMELVAAPNFRQGNEAKALSFAESLYFSLATMATVGYGDIVPASDLARVVSSIEVVAGLLILLFGFSEIMEYARQKRREKESGGRHDDRPA